MSFANFERGRDAHMRNAMSLSCTENEEAVATIGCNFQVHPTSILIVDDAKLATLYLF